MADKQVNFDFSDVSPSSGARQRTHHASSQEDTDPIENMTFSELKESLRARNKDVVNLTAQLQALHLEFFDMRCQLAQQAQVPVTRPPEVVSTVTSTTTTNTWSRPMGLPCVSVGQSPFASGISVSAVSDLDFNQYLTSPKGSSGYYPPPHQGSVPPGFKPLPRETVVPPSTTPLAPPETEITLDDSSESTSTTSRSSEDSHRSDLRMVVKSLERRSCPKPEVYSLESGRSFSRFLKSFEAYCESKFSSVHRHLWTTELGRYLDGEILQVFAAHGVSEQKYNKMKRYLETWLVGAKDRMSQSRNAKYRSAV